HPCLDRDRPKCPAEDIRPAEPQWRTGREFDADVREDDGQVPSRGDAEHDRLEQDVETLPEDRVDKMCSPVPRHFAIEHSVHIQLSSDHLKLRRRQLLLWTALEQMIRHRDSVDGALFVQRRHERLGRSVLDLAERGLKTGGFFFPAESLRGRGDRGETANRGGHLESDHTEARVGQVEHFGERRSRAPGSDYKYQDEDRGPPRRHPTSSLPTRKVKVPHYREGGGPMAHAGD